MTEAILRSFLSLTARGELPVVGPGHVVTPVSDLGHLWLDRPVRIEGQALGLLERAIWLTNVCLDHLVEGPCVIGRDHQRVDDAVGRARYTASVRSTLSIHSTAAVPRNDATRCIRRTSKGTSTLSIESWCAILFLLP